MKFEALALEGAYLLEIEPVLDERGFFSRLFCEEEFRRHGLETHFVQASMSFNKTRGTLRGLHLQVPPFEEVKLVRVTRGSIFDVIVDLRPDSPSYRKHLHVILSAENRQQLYIPAGFAHGFQTLEDGAEVCYQMTQVFNAASARGFLWSDPTFAIPWPLENPILSPKDRVAPPFSPELLAG